MDDRACPQLGTLSYMKGRHNINHILYGLTELALVVMLVGLAVAYGENGKLSTLLSMILAATLLALNVRSHIKLVAICRLEELQHIQKQAHEVEVTRTADDSTEKRQATVQDDNSSLGEERAHGQVHVSSDDPKDQVEAHQSEPACKEVAETDLVPAGNTQVTPTQTALEPEAHPALDYSSLVTSLLGASDPISELKRFVGNIRTREAEHADDPALAPCGLELFAARRLSEAGLFEDDVELPPLTVVRPETSRMLYLRTTHQRIPYLAKLRIIALEAALNAIRFANSALPADASEEDAFRANQALARSIVAQALPIDEPIVPADGASPDGEWAVRYGISEAIETMQLPYRLVARFRTNVADGNVAIEVNLTPAEVFPASCYVDGLGIVGTTGDMRQQASADYALRLAVLMAASAFRCSERIRHVWVAGIVENAKRRTCYYSVDFDRYRFSKLDLEDLGDLAETYRAFAPMMRYEDGWLRPVKQGFHLEEERFCPIRRYVPVSLSSRRLSGRTAESLGTDHVSGLSIEESDGRALVANAIMMRLVPSSDERSTQKNVRAVLDLAADDPDPTVRTAAERVVHGLIDGTLDDDAYTVAEEFIRGDALTRANDRAKELLMRQDVPKAQRVLQPVIDALDKAGVFDDSPTVIYRYFGSYVDRALYNRLWSGKDAGRTVMLVPDAYYEAHVLLSVTNMMQGDNDRALAHARRAVAMAPMDSRSRLHLVKCLENLNRDDEAIDELNALLEEAHDPMSLGAAYYRMAFFQWRRGNVEAAQACYHEAIKFMPMTAPMVGMELSMLYLQNPGTLSAEASEEELEGALEANGITIAPTDHTSEVFLQCAQASLDAEIFPVARNFAAIMGAFTGDDVLVGLLRSLEDAPDH